MRIDIKKCGELCEMELEDFISEMFSGTGYAINPKSDAEYDATKAAVEYAYAKEDITVEKIFAHMLTNGKTLVVTDPERKDHDFTIETLEEGLDRLLQKAPEVFRDFVHGNNDLCSAMALIDCAIFGEVVYG